MTDQNQQLEDLKEIRSLMERSVRFISLSGLSGICAGIFALLGAAAAYIYLKINILSPNYYHYAYGDDGIIKPDFITFFFLDAAIVLVLSLLSASYFTIRKAKRRGYSIWDASAKRLLINLIIPLAAGGIFCLILLYHGQIGLIAPCTLLFYGLALVNAGKYTFNDVRYLGISQIIVGLISSVFFGYGLLFWILGFGIFHILYGIIMYRKYENN